MSMPLFFLYSLVYIICPCILIISLHPFMSFRIKVLMQITLNMFLFILQDLFGSPFFCDLCFDILPCISSWSQHAFPFKVTPSLSSSASIPDTASVSVTSLFNDLQLFFSPTLWAFALLISHTTCHLNFRILINIFHSLHFSSSMFYADIQSFKTSFHTMHLCLSQFLLYYLIELITLLFVRLQKFTT